MEAQSSEKEIITKRKKLYAVLDIETTGGKFNEEGITEIAIYKFDGHKVVDQFISLINPEQPIQPFVVKLTGINNNMLTSAPKFYEVAKRIVEITSDCTLVAHNADFDYRILRTEFRRLGFEYERSSICTVELAQQLLPGQISYSLGKLSRSLGIPIADRHRASGDAQATVKLFKLLLDKDSRKNILKKMVKSSSGYSVNSKKLLQMLEEVPSITGVYYFYDKEGEIIYIGKSKNIKKQINKHFTSDSTKAKLLQREVESITYEATGNELFAILKENEEVKINRPKFNIHNLSQRLFNFALYSFTDEKGYVNLYLDKIDDEKEPITTFVNYAQGNNFITKATADFKLCSSLINKSKRKGECLNYSVQNCDGACIEEETPEAYNSKIEQLLEKISFKNKDVVLIDKGRQIDEKSVVLIEDGLLKGIGYFQLNHQIKSIESVRSIITPMEHDVRRQHLLQNYLRKNKKLKMLQFNV